MRAAPRRAAQRRVCVFSGRLCACAVAVCVRARVCTPRLLLCRGPKMPSASSARAHIPIAIAARCATRARRAKLLNILPIGERIGGRSVPFPRRLTALCTRCIIVCAVLSH